MKGDFKNKLNKRLASSNRRLTKREFAILGTFLCLAMIYIMYNYFLGPKLATYGEIKDKFKLVENNKNVLEKEYLKREQYLEEIKTLEQGIRDIKFELPTYLAQEEEILTLKSISDAAHVKISGESFSQATTEDIKAYLIKDDKRNDELPSTKGYVLSREISLNVEGSYDQVYDFLQRIDQNKRKIYVSSASFVRNEDGFLRGALKLKFIAYVKDGVSGDYSIRVPVSTEKENIFTPYLGYSNSSNENIVNKPTADFDLFIGSYLTNGTKIVLRKAGRNETEVGFDKNDTVNADLTINSKGNGYIEYKYTLNGKSFTESIKAQPQENKLWLFVYSKTRRDLNDKVDIKMSIHNNTDYQFVIKVYNEDEEDPRFVLGETTGKVAYE